MVLGSLNNLEQLGEWAIFSITNQLISWHNWNKPKKKEVQIKTLSFFKHIYTQYLKVLSLFTRSTDWTWKHFSGMHHLPVHSPQNLHCKKKSVKIENSKFNGLEWKSYIDDFLIFIFCMTFTPSYQQLFIEFTIFSNLFLSVQGNQILDRDFFFFIFLSGNMDRIGSWTIVTPLLCLSECPWSK